MACTPKKGASLRGNWPESALRESAQSWCPRRSGNTRSRELVTPNMRPSPRGMESLVEFTGQPVDGTCASDGGVFEQENGNTPATPLRELRGTQLPW